MISIIFVVVILKHVTINFQTATLWKVDKIDISPFYLGPKVSNKLHKRKKINKENNKCKLDMLTND